MIPQAEFNCEIVYARFYLDYNAEMRIVLRNEQLVNLSDLAEVIPSYCITDRKSKEVMALDGNQMPRYPYDSNRDTVQYIKTTVQLHKGDIVENRGKFFLVDKESDFEIYAPAATNVIRVNGNVSAEYLYLYLTSQIARRIRNVLIIPSGEKSPSSSRRLDEFPIVLPKEAEEIYRKCFEKIASPDERVYQKLNPPEPQNTVTEILQAELIETIKLNNEELLRSQIRNDLREFNACYEAGSYKAAILMVGCILEAFLIDWLSNWMAKIISRKILFFP